MQNPIKMSPQGVAGQATELAQGADEHGATIDLGGNTGAAIRLDIAAVLAAIAAYEQGKEDLKKARELRDSKADVARRFLMRARDGLKPTLGYTHNSSWNSAGLNGSLNVPREPLALLPMLAAFKAYLVEHPTAQDEEEGVTPAAVDLLYNELDATNGAANAMETTAKQLLETRNDKAKALRLRIRATISTLARTLSPLDARWASFGLNEPGRKLRPDQPTGLKVVLKGATALSVDWPRVARTEYYRLWKRVVGSDEAMVPVGTPADLDFTLTGLSPGAVIELAVSAINNGGESPLSEVLSVTMPA